MVVQIFDGGEKSRIAEAGLEKLHSPFPHLGQTSNIKFPPCSKHFYKAGIPTPKIPSPCKMHLCGHTPYNARSAGQKDFIVLDGDILFTANEEEYMGWVECIEGLTRGQFRYVPENSGCIRPNH